MSHPDSKIRISSINEDRSQIRQIPIDRDISEEEKELAAGIFDAYCEFRRSQGFSVPKWDSNLAGIAYVSCVRCSKTRSLGHRYGIEKKDEGRISDILQYSTWKMSAKEPVQRWADSPGHRSMMECPSAEHAGVATYCGADGVWYYAIVYDFKMTNANTLRK